MKKWFCLSLILISGVAQAKLSDQQSMKCINADKLTHLEFQDLQAAYDMRLVSAKDFFRVMDAPNCAQLKKDLKKLHGSALAAFPQTKLSFHSHKSGSDSDFAESHTPQLGAPPPPPLSEADFDDDFSDFR
ncbi:MAG TPA: hypothetical protein VIG33_08505 [Pseudobdellovibrionaceae bacterium]|jgi:hypothetical protein